MREGSRLIGCIFASSQVIFTRIDVEAIAWSWGIVWHCRWMAAAQQLHSKWQCLINVYLRMYVWGKARAWLVVSLQVLKQFSQELMWRQQPDGKELFGVVGRWQQHCNHIRNCDVWLMCTLGCMCEGRLALDWMCLRKFLSDFCKNWCGGNSLMVRNWWSSSVDGSGAAIIFDIMMFDWCLP